MTTSKRKRMNTTIPIWQEREKSDKYKEESLLYAIAEITELRERVAYLESYTDSQKDAMRVTMDELATVREALKGEQESNVRLDAAWQRCMKEKGELQAKLSAIEAQEPAGDAERQSRDIAHAYALFSNLKLQGEHSALMSAFGALWPSAFSHGFQTAKEIYSAEAAQPVCHPANVTSDAIGGGTVLINLSGAQPVNEWKEAVLDLLAIACSRCPFDMPPTDNIKLIVSTAVEMAIDPAISTQPPTKEQAEKVPTHLRKNYNDWKNP